MTTQEPAPAKRPGKTTAQQRQERLAAALRDNLRKRKEQARAQATTENARPGDEPQS